MASLVEQIIRPFLAKAPSKAEIDAGEKAFDDAKRDQPAALVEGLFVALTRADLEVAAREQAVVLLRKCLQEATCNENSLWKRLGAGQKVVQDQLLQVLQAETVGVVRRKVADCVQALGNQIVDIKAEDRPNNIQEWPDLLPTLLRLIVDSSKDSGTRGDCLYTVKELMMSVWQVMIANGEQTLQVLAMCFQDASQEVCGNALALFIELLENLSSKDERKRLAPLLPEVAKVLQKVASGNDPKPLKNVLTILSNQQEVSRFFKDILGELMSSLCLIARDHQDEDSRKLAIEAIINLFTTYPGGTATAQGLVQQALETCVFFMMKNLNDDVEEWSTLEEGAELDDEELYRIGRDNIDRLCQAAQQAGKGKDGQEDRKYLDQLLELLKPVLSTLLSTGQWKETVVALSIFQQIAEHVDDEATVTQLLSGVQAQLKATHPRVRYAAWICVQQFAEDHNSAMIVEPCVGQLMAEFCNGLDEPIERVWCRGMEAFQTFGESVEREDMESWVKPMMLKIAPKLKGPSQVQRMAITTVAVFAGQVEDSFAEYYGDLMPYLKGIIGETLHKVEERTLLGKCFECISLLAKAVGRTGFRQDAESIMEAMIKATQVPNLRSDDPVKEYMLAASSRICSVMKEEFLPMVPHILPGILEKFKLAPKDLADRDQLKGSSLEDTEVTLTMTRGPDGQVKFLFMSTSEVEELHEALDCVHQFIEELGAHYAPFVAETAKALLPVFEFNIDEDIRDMAFETWGNLCQCSRDANQAGAVNDLVMEFLKQVTPAFEQKVNIDLDALKTKADGITCTLKKAGPNILQPEHVSSLCQLTINGIAESFKRRQEVQEKKAKKARDKDDVEEGEDEEEENLRAALIDVAGALMKHHPEAFMSCGLQSYLELVSNLKQSNFKADRKLFLSIACEFLDHLGTRAVPHWEKFMPVVLEDSLCPDPLRRQNACFAISVAARETAFAPVALETAKNLQKVVTESRGRAKKKSEKATQSCADNALSGIRVILQSHKEALGTAHEELWDVWLQGLPCQEDKEEGVKNHKDLLRFVMEERPEVLKQGASNFPKVLSILVSQYKTDMVDKETNEGIQQLVRNLGQARLEQFAADLSDKQKKKLLRVHREATSA